MIPREQRGIDWPLVWFSWLLWAIAIAAAILIAGAAMARDSGQWSGEPAIRQWYQALMQPDVPTASCCGSADAYFCDEVNVKKGKTFCRITDDRPDEPLGRPHVPIFVFLSRAAFCYVQPGGV